MISGVEMPARNEFSVMISCAAARGENPAILARSGAAATASASKSAPAAAKNARRLRRLERRRGTSRRSQMSFLKIADSLFQSTHQHLNLLRRNNVRRSNQNMIAWRAVRAALNRISHPAGLQLIGLHSKRYARIRRKWRARLGIAHEFNRQQQAHSANIAHHRKFP